MLILICMPSAPNECICFILWVSCGFVGLYSSRLKILFDAFLVPELNEDL